MKKLSFFTILIALPLMAVSCGSKTNSQVTPQSRPAAQNQDATKPAAATKTYTSTSLGVSFDYPGNYNTEERDGAIVLINSENPSGATEGPYLSISLSDDSLASAVKKLHDTKLPDGKPAVVSDVQKQYGSYTGNEITYILEIGGTATEVLIPAGKGTAYFNSDGENSLLPEIVSSFKLTK